MSEWRFQGKTRNHPLTDAQKASNKQKSRIRFAGPPRDSYGQLRAQTKLTLQSVSRTDYGKLPNKTVKNH